MSYVFYLYISILNTSIVLRKNKVIRHPHHFGIHSYLSLISHNRYVYLSSFAK